ncbi:MAG: putative rane protein [Microbacteriaceae bacterium]|nr:putative rane protein [Microbacteriaceae bacterium]
MIQARAARRVAIPALALLLLAGCTPAVHHTAQPSVPVDPLSEVIDPHNSRYIAQSVPTLLHQQGKGSVTATIDELGSTTKSVRFFVSCSPSSRFTLTMSGSYSGPCGTTFENTGEISISPGQTSSTVILTLPRGVRFWLLAIPIL